MNLSALRIERLYAKGVKKGLIQDFPPELIEESKKHYYCGNPLYVFLHEGLSLGKCYDRSYALTMCFDKCNLVRGALTEYGKAKRNPDDPDFGHGWVEDDKYVYDTTFLKRFDKKFYYKLFKVRVDTVVSSDELNKDEEYFKMKNTTREDIENSIGLEATNAWLMKVVLEEREKNSGKDLSYLKAEVPDIDIDEVNKKIDDKCREMMKKKSKDRDDR